MSRSRDSHGEARSDGRRTSQKESKGNVIVSVRVRPDDAKGDARTEGEWMVDGRRSLVAFKGKEGGDYIYGKRGFGIDVAQTDNS